jgi:branched-chain amino acid transport system substrate-binding protein
MQRHSLTATQIRFVRPVLTLAFVFCSVLACSKPKEVVAPKYDPGVTDTEIKIGQTMPYSGPASAYGTIGRAEAAYFKKINEAGGINGRKINFIS